MAETKRITVPAAEEIMGLYFPLHDHGFLGVKDYMGGDDSIEGAARGSYAYGTRIKTEQRGLIRSLTRRRHTSPIEQVEIVVHAAMPIFVARQWVRHRTASLNEMSGRYSLMPMLFHTPKEEQIKAQSKTDKQGRDEGLAGSVPTLFRQRLIDGREGIEHDYRWATENDIARELARIDLPLSTYTQWIWKIDLHNLFHALGLRCDLHAQWETRQYFNVLAGMAKRLAPTAFEAWEDYHFYAKTFSRMEMEMVRRMVFEIVGPNGVRSLSTGIEYLRLNKDARDKYRMTKTEMGEFYDKFAEPVYTDFDLNLSEGKPGEYFEEKFRKAAEG